VVRTKQMTPVASSFVIPASEHVLDQRSASFETAAPQLPQDKGFLNAINSISHPEGAQRARLEGRTVPLQPMSQGCRALEAYHSHVRLSK
jgi:hypothetical protein